MLQVENVYRRLLVMIVGFAHDTTVSRPRTKDESASGTICLVIAERRSGRLAAASRFE